VQGNKEENYFFVIPLQMEISFLYRHPEVGCKPTDGSF